MDVIVEESWNFYEKLSKNVDGSNRDIKYITTLYGNLKLAYENMAKSLNTIAENFHKEISRENNQNEMLVYIYQTLCNQILKIAQLHRDFVYKFDAEVIEPFELFSSNLFQGNYDTLDKVQKMLIQLQNSKLQMAKLQENYFKNTQNADKSQLLFEKLVEETKEEAQIIKLQEKTLKLKMQAQESCSMYKKQIAATNQSWETYYNEFPTAFNFIDDNEVSRLAFTRNNITGALKHLINVYSHNDAGTLIENYEEKFKEYDALLTAKHESFKNICKGALDEAFKVRKPEEFLSYEVMKKMQDSNMIQTTEYEDYTLISTPTNERDLQKLLDFVRGLLNSGSGTLPVSRRASTNLSDTASVDSDSSLEKEKDNEKENPSNTGDIKEILDIVSNPSNRKFFLDNLVKSKDPSHDLYEVRLRSSQFNPLVELLLKIVENMGVEEDIESLYTVLNICTKFYHKQKDKKKYLNECLRSLPIWSDHQFWLKLAEFLQEKETADQRKNSLDSPGNIEMSKSGKKVDMMKSIFNFGKKQLGGFFETKKQGLNKEIINSVYNKINFYLAKMSMNYDLSANLFISIAKEHNFENKDIGEMLFIQRAESDVSLKEHLLDLRRSKKQRAVEKWGKLYPIYGAADYLEPKDLAQLLLVNREWKKRLSKHVYRVVMRRFGNKITHNQRKSIWVAVLKPWELQIDFKELKQKVKDAPEKIKGVDDVITIDVQRSFTIHKNFDREALHLLLQCYAVYDTKRSYCQGMNYIMGFLLITLEDEELAFRCFCQVMTKYMKTLFEDDFDKLKLYFGCFKKFIEINLPDLSHHFKVENVNPSFFMASWFITIFTNVLQYTQHSHTVIRIWDMFLLDGILTVMRVAMAILKINEKKLIGLKFDQVMHFFGDMGKSEIFKNEKYLELKQKGEVSAQSDPSIYLIENIWALMEESGVTRKLLNELERTYILFDLKLAKYIPPGPL